MNQKLQMLIRRREKAQTRMANAESSKNRYNNSSIDKYERDIAQELIEEMDEVDF